MDLLLQIPQEPACMSTIHLRVMELEGNGQCIAEELLAVAAPYDEWVVENTAVHAYGTVDLSIDNGGGADDHAGF